MPSAKLTVWMMTENGHKLHEARAILKDYGIIVRQEETVKAEIQSDSLKEIAIHALERIPKTMRNRHALFVEDSGLFIEALHGFPGPYSSYANKTIGIEGILRLLGSTKRRRAYFESAVALSIPSVPREVFVGRVWGRISNKPRGNSGFGFDPIFVPNGSRLTHSEMGVDAKNRRSHRAVALGEMASWLRGNYLMATRKGTSTKP